MKRRMARNTSKMWGENALLVTVAGSIIVVIGQLAGTIIPIMYGPADISDFDIIVDPPVVDIGQTPYVATPTVNVEDRHRWIRPYGHTVHLEAIMPSNLAASFQKNNLRPPFETELAVWPTNLSNETRYEIAIMGTGGDGRKRNTTFLIKKVNPLEMPPAVYVPSPSASQ